MTDKGKEVLQLPEAHYPVCARVWAVKPDEGSVITYTLGEKHPTMENLKVVRMYVANGESVDVYAGDADGKIGVRHTIPWHMVRFAEEVMDAQTFIDEITLAESEEEPEPPRPAPQPNGQPAQA